MDYRYALDGVVAEDILSLPARQRSDFIRIFRSLAAEPYQMGDRSFKDSSGREIQQKRFGCWLVSYWTDHAVAEVRVVGIQRLRQ